MIKKLSAIGNSLGLVIERPILDLCWALPRTRCSRLQPTGRLSSFGPRSSAEKSASLTRRSG